MIWAVFDSELACRCGVGEGVLASSPIVTRYRLLIDEIGSALLQCPSAIVF